MCEVILYGDPDYIDNWPAEHKKNALAYLKFLESFFAWSLSRSLLYLKEAIVHIQGIGQDIVSGVHRVMECCRKLKGVRNDVDGFSNHIFQYSSRIAETSGISVSMPRVSG